ncbi:HEPN domain-containing protein [Trichormus variabilis]|uniref:RiboL-PSP-HEPN domain-containing protein n=1 Tax=Trichormus variabilis SAG 1403-4b TaxID=447716 RepID=A0A433UFD0_ANAVA|nr:HEPN domain-containing protein [Trichormus variabilis]MBD2629763.1 hypothetical protein [Trichormus variabilis FACHB-164]RUS92583.1 hypothetical protein DSM107003_49630 [Trichormus variabilis SAG 1403-4b]
MPKSTRFRILTRELNRLKKQLIPKPSLTGLYSNRQLTRTIAYRVLAHAEIESYLEERALEVVRNAKNIWDNTGKINLTLICLLGFSGLNMDEPPETLSPQRGSRTVKDEKIKIKKKIDLALANFNRVINENHGLKEKNLLALLLPIGLDIRDLDTSWLATMNTFGENRGEVAHKSATFYSINQQINPVDEVNMVKQIIQELLRIDELMNQLMQ